ncbi:hypothetical protein [Halorhodospira halochloris]|uniref:hypothetical protein n=1 Tax=Halorhodospira halochloris TaxID=1052 RepID=UPI001EE7E8AE|nr:hypothetical protein [Halorhodospira halochloris]MCG5547983.1 hypothetical protein [Halorhodospira halochloris]
MWLITGLGFAECAADGDSGLKVVRVGGKNVCNGVLLGLRHRMASYSQDSFLIGIPALRQPLFPTVVHNPG